MRVSKIIATSALGVLLSATTALPAVAAPAPAADTLTPNGKAFVSSQIKKFDVPTNLRAKLLKKIESGGILDESTGRHKLGKSTLVAGGVTFQVTRFADGSFVAAGLQNATTKTATHRITPQATGTLSGCTKYYGEGVSSFSGCTVRRDTPAVTASFRANYEQTSTSGQIDSIYNYSIQAAGGTYANVSLKTTQKVAGVDPAAARLAYDFTLASGVGEFTHYVWLTVPSNGKSASVTANF